MKMLWNIPPEIAAEIERQMTRMCPSCSGTGGFHAFVDGMRDGQEFGEFRDMTCDRCHGTGEISTEQAVWIIAGERMHRERMARRETLAAMAKRTGLTAVEISRMERGRIEPLLSSQTAEGEHAR